MSEQPNVVLIHRAGADNSNWSAEGGWGAAGPANSSAELAQAARAELARGARPR